MEERETYRASVKIEMGAQSGEHLTGAVRQLRTTFAVNSKGNYESGFAVEDSCVDRRVPGCAGANKQLDQSHERSMGRPHVVAGHCADRQSIRVDHECGEQS